MINIKLEPEKLAELLDYLDDYADRLEEEGFYVMEDDKRRLKVLELLKEIKSQQQN